MPAEITQEVRQSLQEAFLEVAFRANRLKEWMGLNQRLRALEISFSDFSGEVREVAAVINAGGATSLQRLDGRWSRSRQTDFIDLQSFATGVRYINRSSHNEAAGAPPPAVGGGLPRVDISSLVQMVDAVDQALTGRLIGDLGQRCTRFELALGGLIADCRHVITRELDELCEITIQLRMQF